MVRAIIQEGNGFEMYRLFENRKDLDQYLKNSKSKLIKILAKKG